MEYIIPNWQAPPNIKALTTTRDGGISINEFSSNNFGLHVEDNIEHVLANRLKLKDKFNLPGEPIWLNQTHSNRCVVVTDSTDINADAAISRDFRFPLVIMTADCVPILICNKKGTEIAAIHAGWKGLRNGIIENTFAKLLENPEEYIAWIGPAICENCYPTGEEVFTQFTEKYSFTKSAFTKINLKTHVNLPLISEMILGMVGVKNIYQSNKCTFEESNQFYSYRKSEKTGRMATLIWF